jgi:hypothetical protein
VPLVAYAEREQRIRIISARRATQHEQDDYFQQNAWPAAVHERAGRRTGCAF